MGSWTQITDPLSYYSRNLVVLNNKLYCSKQRYGGLYEWGGGSTWTQVAPDFGAGTENLVLIVFGGKLYTSPGYATLYEWDGGFNWSARRAVRVTTNTSYLHCSGIFNGKLYAGGYQYAHLHEWNGVDAWALKTPWSYNSEIRALIEFNGELCCFFAAGVSPKKWNGIDAFVDVPSMAPLGTGSTPTALLIHNGKLYKGLGGALIEWDGTNAATAVATTALGTILGLVELDGSLYASGVGGYLVKWNGVDAFEEIIPSTVGKTFWAIVELNGVIYGVDEGSRLYSYTPPPPTPPTADFTATPTTGYTPLTINFTDTSTGVPTTWDWDFGDGSAHGTTQSPTHIYIAPGTYTVTLIATNSAGSDTEIKTDYITGMVVDVTTLLLACGYDTSGCVIWGSSNNGVTWTVKYSDASGGRVNRICVGAGQTVLALTQAGNILRSVDGGDTWTDLGVKVAASAAYVGGIVHVSGSIFVANGSRTVDNGDNWTVVVSYTRCIGKFSDGSLIAATTDVLKRSIDGGLTWSADIVHTNPAGGYTGATPYNFLDLGVGIGILVGEVWYDSVSNTRAYITRTTDYGATWPGVSYVDMVGSTNFEPLGQTSRVWQGMAAAPNGDVYATVFGGGIYKQTGGIGNFESLGQTDRYWKGMAAAPNGDVYAGTDGDKDIYKQTGGVGNFESLGQTNSYSWQGMAAAPNGDVYACTGDSGNIYKQTGGVGNFISLSQTTRIWRGMAAAPNGDVYAAVYNGNIYKQTGGVGNFISLSQTTRNWIGMAAAPNGDVYASVYYGDIYKQTGGVGNFEPLGQTGRFWTSMAVAPNGDVYASVQYTYPNGDIYKLSSSPLSSRVYDAAGMPAQDDYSVFRWLHVAGLTTPSGGPTATSNMLKSINIGGAWTAGALASQYFYGLYYSILAAKLFGGLIGSSAIQSSLDMGTSWSTVYTPGSGAQFLDFVDGPPPSVSANFVASPLVASIGELICFDDLSTGSPTSWLWDFGDDTTSILQNPSHQYTASGMYTVSLVAANSAGFDTETKTAYITISVVDFVSSPRTGLAPLTVQFTDLSV